MNRRELLGSTASIAVGGIAGCIGSDPADSGQTTETDEPSNSRKCEDARLEACGYDENYDGEAGGEDFAALTANWGFLQSENTVAGTAEFSRDESLRCAAVQACFFDADGTLVGVASTQRDHLDAGEIWAFEVSYTGQDGDRIEAAEVDSDYQHSFT